MLTSTLRQINSLLEREAGISLPSANESLIEARLERLIYDQKISSIKRLFEMLNSGQDPELKSAIVNALLVHETSFFRDTHPFSMLRDHILPSLIESREPRRRLKLWSAACSTGQEPFSLAFMLDDVFPELRNWDISILATDLSGPILEKAKSAVFHQIAVNRGLPASYLVKYFIRQGLYWQLIPEIRKMVHFEAMNLSKPWPLIERQDVILLRNVLIYLNDETRRHVLREAHRVLADDGFLILGATESTINIIKGFKLVKSGRTVYYRKSKP